MRPSLALLVFLSLQLLAAEAPASYPLWDGHESVESYAARIKWPATKSIDLGKGVTMDFVLIPAGRFIMGTPAPKEPTVTADSCAYMLFAGMTLFLGFLSVLILRKIQGKKVAYSLRYLLLMTVFGGLIFGSFGRSKLAEEQVAKYEEELVFYRNLPLEEKPGKEVTIGQPFYMGKYVVTEQQYAVLMPMPKTIMNDENTLPTPGVYLSSGENAPIKCSWDDAHEFCDKLNALITERLIKSNLATSAQWEFACRAGTTTKFYSGNDEHDLDAVGWYSNNSKGKLHAVGLKKPNTFGLYDMHGNIWQWCEDVYTNPKLRSYGLDGASLGRIIRGGYFISPPDECRSATRSDDFKANGHNGVYWYVFSGIFTLKGPIGFRVILKPSPKP